MFLYYKKSRILRKTITTLFRLPGLVAQAVADVQAFSGMKLEETGTSLAAPTGTGATAGSVVFTTFVVGIVVAASVFSVVAVVVVVVVAGVVVSIVFSGVLVAGTGKGTARGTGGGIAMLFFTGMLEEM